MNILFDIEGDSLTPTKIHCVSYAILDGTETPTIKSLTTYSEIKELFLNPNVKNFIGHNIILFDIPVVERILNIKIKASFIDTLALSWYLYPMQRKHGLETWGEYFGIPKPVITSWTDLPIETYVARCEEDVKINLKLYFKQSKYLLEIYNSKQKVQRILNYLNFKMDCAREQEEVRWLLDVELCQKTLEELLPIQEEKLTAIKSFLPDVITYKTVSRPEKFLKADGELTKRALKWLELLRSLELESNYKNPITVESKKTEGNPTSTSQIKKYLFSIGWKPTVFKYTQTLKGINKVPQISTDGEICEGIKNLYPEYPLLENLESLSILNHRINILKGFLRDKSEDNYVKARIRGLTNTLRFQHTELVNLPSVDKPFSENIRRCLTCKEDEYLCGSDMSSLEDKTKQHYIYFFDPEYVKELQTPGFDPHLDIAVRAKLLTEEECQEHRNKIVDHSVVRKKAKIVNFSAVYGVGAMKMHLSTGMPIEQCKNLLDAYWKRNKAVKLVAKNVEVKTINDQMWLFNPISEFWYSLRFEKDIFSTLNQGSGVYCFDNYVTQVRKRGVKICGQFHDEIAFTIPKSVEKSTVKKLLQDSIDAVNNRLKLNIELGISVDFGKNYAEIH